MKKVYLACIASMMALGAMSAVAADLTPDERSELRQRADGLRSQKQREPGWDGGQRRVNESRMNDSRGDVRLNQNRGEVKAKAKATARSAKPGKSKRERAKNRMKRTAKEMPGALVRK